MATSDDQVATLRAQLAGSLEEHKRRLRRLDPNAAAIGYTALIAAALFEVVDRRFAKSGATRADVADFVGNIQAESEESGREFDLQLAEHLILAALGMGSIVGVDDETRIQMQILLLGLLVADQEYDDAGLDKFLTEARKTADHWIGRTQNR